MRGENRWRGEGEGKEKRKKRKIYCETGGEGKGK